MVKEKIGHRPAKYRTVAELRERIDTYFQKEVGYSPMTDLSGNVIFDKFDKPLMELKPPTIAGLSLYLGFADRQSLYNYRDRKVDRKVDETDEEFKERELNLDTFACIIKSAIAKIESFAETQLYAGKPTGAIFWLKNHGWKDKIETVNTNTNVNLKEDDEQAIKKYAAKIAKDTS